MNELTNKQLLFVEEYMIDFNATQAAIRAGYSEKTANEQGARLLANVSVKNEINRRCKEISNEYPLLRKKIVDRLQKIAFSDIKDMLSFKTVKTVVGVEDGEPVIGYKTVIDLKDSNEVDGALISEVQETRDGFKFKRVDSMKALELLGKYTGLENAEIEELKAEIEKIKKTIGGIDNDA